MADGLKANDGHGLWDNMGVCDVLLETINQLPKLLIDNQFVSFCKTLSDMAEIVVNLKKGIADDLKSRDENIEILKETIKNMGGSVDTVPVENFIAKKDGANNGSN